MMVRVDLKLRSDWLIRMRKLGIGMLNCLGICIHRLHRVDEERTRQRVSKITSPSHHQYFVSRLNSCTLILLTRER